MKKPVAPSFRVLCEKGGHEAHGGKSKIDHLLRLGVVNTESVPTKPLTQKRILSVKCPVCRAKPGEKCTMTTGHPSDKTHLDRSRAAAKAPPPENAGYAALRSLHAFTSRGLRALFQHK